MRILDLYLESLGSLNPVIGDLPDSGYGSAGASVGIGALGIGVSQEDPISSYQICQRGRVIILICIDIGFAAVGLCKVFSKILVGISSLFILGQLIGAGADSCKKGFSAAVCHSCDSSAGSFCKGKGNSGYSRTFLSHILFLDGQALFHRIVQTDIYIICRHFKIIIPFLGRTVVGSFIALHRISGSGNRAQCTEPVSANVQTIGKGKVAAAV